MLKLMAIPHVLHMKETIPTSRRTNNCGGEHDGEPCECTCVSEKA